MQVKESPNKYSGRNGWTPDIIVYHITEGSYKGAIEWLCNPVSQASAHYVVSKKGEVTQLVDLEDSSWCQGTATDSSKSTYYGYATNSIVKSRKCNANYYTIGIEHEGIFKTDKGEMPEAQLNAMVDLTIEIIDKVKSIYGKDIPIDRDHLIMHCEVTPKTKPNCAGSKFQIDQVISRVQAHYLNGWHQENGQWFVYQNGEKLKNTWFKSEGEWYYLHSSGEMLASQWFEYKDKWYYFHSDGHMAKNEIIDNKYSVNEEGIWEK